MAEPTFKGNPGGGPAVAVIDAINAGPNEDILGTYGYRNAVILRSIKDSDWTPGTGSEVHLILGKGAPHSTTDCDGAPSASLYFNKDGVNDQTHYAKTIIGAAGTEKWAPVTNEADA